MHILSRRDDRLLLAWEAGELPLPEGPVAVLRAVETGLYERAGPGRFRLQQGFRPLHDRLAAAGLAVAPTLLEAAAAAVVVATRDRADTLGAVAAALAMVPEAAPVAVAGARADGIDAVLREVAGALPLAGSMAKAHGRVFRIARPAVLPPAVAAWAEAAALRPNRDGFVSGPGMFSVGGIDEGSARLAGHLPGRLSGRVADLGAGWGWLARRALEENPGIEALDLHEAEARALEAARRNVTDLRAAFHWTDVGRLAGPGRYDWVVTNPPFHRGRAAEPALGAAFVAAAARVLKPAGRLLVVANRSLPYEAPLAAAFRTVTPLAEDAAYKVVEAAGPRAASAGGRRFRR